MSCSRIIAVFSLLILLSVSTVGHTPAETDKSKKTSHFAVTSRIASEALATANYLSPNEKQMLHAINELRTDPRGYLNVVLDAYDAVRRDSMALMSQVSEIISTEWVYEESGVQKQSDTTYRNHYVELVSAYRSLIAELRIQEPLPPLLPHSDLHKAAVGHAMDQSPFQYIQHWGTNGTWPQDRIRDAAPWSSRGNENIVAGTGSIDELLLQLMVDSGVEGYGHRRNLLDPNWTHVTCHEVLQISNGNLSWWIQEFAN